MIANPQRLWKCVPPGTVQAYKLELVDHFLLKPLAKQFGFTITSAYRSIDTQANLLDSAGNKVPDYKKAKGISQHCTGEAVDVDAGNSHKNKALFQYAIEHLAPWQIILYLEEGAATSVHLSIPSENETIVQKQLLNVDGAWRWFRGDFQDVVDLRRT